MSLDLFWLRDESLEDADALTALEALAASIAASMVEDLQAALEQLAAISEELSNGVQK